LVEEIVIPPIHLVWSEWFPWNDLLVDARGGHGVRVPTGPGVYEARRKGKKELLTIGKAANLRMRVKQGLVKGKVPHSAGDKIRTKEDVDLIEIRWASTDRPAAVEEELHRRYRKALGRLPLYVDHT